MGLEMKVKEITSYTRTGCDICGDTIEKGENYAYIEEDGTIWAADVCPTCVLVGPVEAAKRARAGANDMRARAIRMQEAANELERDAVQIETMTQWLTLADLRNEREPEMDADNVANWEKRIRAFSLGDPDAKAEFDAEREKEMQAQREREEEERQARVTAFKEYIALIKLAIAKGDGFEWTKEAMDTYERLTQTMGSDTDTPF